MSTIRVPTSLQRLLPFCRKLDNARSDAPFATYADLVCFSACFGFFKRDSVAPQRADSFLSSPYPIEFSVFRDRCSDQVFVVVLASAGSADVLHDEGAMCAILEDFASLGGEELSRMIEERGEESLLPELAALYPQAVETSIQI